MIYLDTCLLIYLVEDRRGRGAAVERRMREASDTDFAISPLVRMEAYVKPLRDGDTMLHRRYEKAIATYSLLGLGAPIFDQAALLRARFGLRTPDALHLAWRAAARLHGAVDERPAAARGRSGVGRDDRARRVGPRAVSTSLQPFGGAPGPSVRPSRASASSSPAPTGVDRNPGRSRASSAPSIAWGRSQR